MFGGGILLQTSKTGPVPKMIYKIARKVVNTIISYGLKPILLFSKLELHNCNKVPQFPFVEIFMAKKEAGY